jgi:hypothetical protein
MSVVGVERKSGASLFEKWKWETVYQFQEVDGNAPKFGQDCIKKSVQPTGNGSMRSGMKTSTIIFPEVGAVGVLV